MAQTFSNAQLELLDLFSTNLSEADLSSLKAILADFARQRSSARVAEPTAPYSNLSATEERITLSIPKAWLDDALFVKLMNWIELKRLTERNQMTESEAVEMGRKVKSDWWERNQQWVLDKIVEP